LIITNISKFQNISVYTNYQTQPTPQFNRDINYKFSFGFSA